MTQAQRSAASQAAVLAAACELIARGGYGRATVKEIGVVAGMSQAAVSQRFGTKAKLLAAVVDVSAARWRLLAPTSEVVRAATSVEAVIDAHLDPWVRDRRHSRLVLMLVYEALGPSPHIRPNVTGLRRQAAAYVEAVIGEAQSTGLVSAEVGPSRAAQHVLSIFLGFLSDQTFDAKTKSGTAQRACRQAIAERLPPP